MLLGYFPILLCGYAPSFCWNVLKIFVALKSMSHFDETKTPKEYLLLSTFTYKLFLFPHLYYILVLYTIYSTIVTTEAFMFFCSFLNSKKLKPQHRNQVYRFFFVTYKTKPNQIKPYNTFQIYKRKKKTFF